MLRKLRSHLLNNVVGYVALFVALGGTAYAAATITGADVVDDSLTGTDIKGKPSPGFVDGSLDTYDVRNKSLLSSDVATNTLTAGELGSNSVSTSEIKDGSVTFSKLAPKWKVKDLIGHSTPSEFGAPGPLPLEATFTSSGGALLFIVSGSAYRTGTEGHMSVDTRIDNLTRSSMQVYTNETSSHKALPSDFFVVTGLAAGQHTIGLEIHNSAGCPQAAYCTSTDGNDFFHAAVIEVPS